MRVGLLIGGGLLAASGLLLLTNGVVHWFPLVMLGLGLVGVFAAFAGSGPHLKQFKEQYLDGPAPVDAAPGAPGQPATSAGVAPAGEAALRVRLTELERLRADGTLTPAEYKRKRQAVIDGWGAAVEPAEG